MNKIKFSCPSCNAKLKVPEKLAGVAGPCPQCGGVIVAPLQSTIPAESVPQTQPAMAGIGVSTATSQPTPRSPEITEKPNPVVHNPAPAIAAQPQPPAPAAPPVAELYPPPPQPEAAPPEVTVPINPEVTDAPFPMPLEQVSHTAAVALANPPAYNNAPVQPPSAPPANPVEMSAPPSGAASPPAASSPGMLDLASKAAAVSEPEVNSESEPEDIFANEIPAVMEKPPASVPKLILPDLTPKAAPEVAPVPEEPVSEPAPYPVPEKNGSAYQEALIPKTQPIVVKKHGGESEGGALPRLDVSLAESGPDTLSDAASHGVSDPTQIQLPPVGVEGAENQFVIKPPERNHERAPYRPPNPVALTPPGAEEGIEAQMQQPVDGFGTGYSEDQIPVQGLPGFQDVEPIPETQLGDGSIGAFLGASMQPEPVQSFPTVSPLQEKSKDDILNELLGGVPKSKKRKKKKGLGKTGILMLSVLGLVAVSAAGGMYWAFETKLGGFQLSKESVQGELGKLNWEKKKAGGIYKQPAGNTNLLSQDNDTTPQPSPVEPIPGETPDSLDSAAIDADLIRGVIDSKEFENVVGEKANVGSEIKQGAENVGQAVEESVGGEIDPLVNANPDPKIAEATEGSSAAPAISAVPVGKVYEPAPSFPAPGPSDPPLTNTHAVVDAYLRAPNWEARIPYIYQGERLRSRMAEYYKKWPDFSLDRYKMKLFQMELDEEFGGPFWVYQIAQNDADTDLPPMIIRVEDGNLKIDWDIFSEFFDQHFVKFREGGISIPHDFRLVMEQVTEYQGSDKPAFTEAKDYVCYELNPPYGGYRAFSEYAFVKKGSPLAEELASKIGLGDEPLAVIISLDQKAFSHGIKHLIITKLISEGWFQP